MISFLLFSQLIGQEDAIGMDLQTTFTPSILTSVTNKPVVPHFEICGTFSKSMGKYFSVVPKIGLSYLREAKELFTVSFDQNVGQTKLSGNITYKTAFIEYGTLFYYHLYWQPNWRFGLGPMLRTQVYKSKGMIGSTNLGLQDYPPHIAKHDLYLKCEIAYFHKIKELLFLKMSSIYTTSFNNYLYDVWRTTRHYWGGLVGLNISL